MTLRPDTRAVLFDLDGVLTDSFEAWLAATNEAAQRFGTPPVTRERLTAVFGQGIAEDGEVLFPGRTVREVQDAYDAALPKHLDRMTLNPEAIEVLETLRQRGIARALVTNTQDSLVHGVLERVGLATHLDVVCASDDAHREKPHPDLLLWALDRVGVESEHALMVGDTAYDEEAARRAGVRFLHYVLPEGTSLTAALGL